MFSRFAPRALRAARQSAPRQAQQAQRLYSADAAPVPPPYMQTLKSSLKNAMRAKDQSRLSVLRAIMSANLNASKTAKPIETDGQLVTLLVSMRRIIDQNIADARTAKRDDIVESETVQRGILDEYIASSGVEVLGEEQLRPLIQKQIESSTQAGKKDKALFGDVVKHVKEAVSGKVVDNSVLANLVKDLVHQSTNQS